MKVKYYIGLILLMMLVPAAVLAGSVQLPQTGQTTCYNASGTVIDCAGTGQDGEKRSGVALPNPRFTNNDNGTVTDNLTGLIWLANANCGDTAGGITKANGHLTWANALTWSNSLASGACGLSDGSAAGDWRLPNRKELLSLIDRQKVNPASPAGHPFSNVQSNYYWSSSTSAYNTGSAWIVSMYVGHMANTLKMFTYYVWPVRGGQ